jgi:hypothetical protein
VGGSGGAAQDLMELGSFRRRTFDPAVLQLVRRFQLGRPPAITTLLARTQELGAVRDDIGTADVGLLFEMLRAIRVGTSARSDALRHRYLDLFAPALRAPADSQLTEPAATWAEISGTWNP